MGRPIGIDLFAGAGGLSLGFEQAGFDIVAAVEIDPIHCAVHKFNFPECAVLPRSVAGLTGAEIRAAAGIGDRPVDCVFGGPPCQGFSLIGHRALDDPRNSLVSEFVRIVSELGAQTFVFENVKGLTVGRHRAFLHELKEAFEHAGYNVRLPWRVLNAADFGVPQRRERLILSGAKKDLNVPDYPTPVKGLGQIEIDELYFGIDSRGCHYVIPVQAKGGNDQISVVQAGQDIAWCAERYPRMRCRAVSAQFMSDERIALFELTLHREAVKVVEERHYKLIPAAELDQAAIRQYRV